MRVNQPVTDNEVRFNADTKLISVTDTRGNIIDCNDAFAAVSGFSKDELINQPHNIIRHPDMPAEAFAIMWQYLKQGMPWKGLVKNRCKNGDYYWVDAYVTPVRENAQIIGYESVRSCPKRDDVARAQSLYQQLNKAQRGTLTPRHLVFAVCAIILVMVLALFFTGFSTMAQILLVLGSLGYALYSRFNMRQGYAQLLALLGDSFSHPLAAKTYVGSDSSLARIKMAILSQESHLDTVLTRMHSTAQKVAHNTEQGYESTNQTSEEIEKQQMETLQVASAMKQMSAAISDLSVHVTDTANQATKANELAGQGNQVGEQTHKAIEQLKQAVEDISQSVSQVSEQTTLIAKAAELIEQIADQTNLLALNAAIEAARAGEQGRGFAVVAEEVRNLAKRTQSSTQEIYTLVDQLTAKAGHAVDSAKIGTQAANDGLEQVKVSGQTLNGISQAVDKISGMSGQMAAAVEEQTLVTNDVNNQVVNISDLAQASTHSAQQNLAAMASLKNAAQEMNELVTRFRRSN